jgi:hypothetical protein
MTSSPLLTETGAYRDAQYEYNGQNRMAYSYVKQFLDDLAALPEREK